MLLLSKIYLFLFPSMFSLILLSMLVNPQFVNARLVNPLVSEIDFLCSLFIYVFS